MKKCRRIISSILVFLLLLSTLAIAEVNKVTGMATLPTHYHQVTALFIEYSENVVAPSPETYVVIDCGLNNMLSEYEALPYVAAEVEAVYTNSEPAVREDKTSVEGRYVVVELGHADGVYFDEKLGGYRPRHIAGLATRRQVGQTSEEFRTDWSLYFVIQNQDVVNAAGEVVQGKGVLPAMGADAVATPEIEMFEQKTLRSQNGLYDIHYNIALPDGYTADREYPIVFCQPGNGGLIEYTQQDENGNFLNVGADLTRSGVPTAFVRQDEDLIVVSVQHWKSAPEEWQTDEVNDYIYLIEYILENYSVDRSRVYAVGDSKGTMIISQAITRRPDLFTAYAQCNGSYMTDPDTRFTLFKDEVMAPLHGKTAEDVWEICGDAENRLSDEEIETLAEPLNAIIENEIPLYVYDGINSNTASCLNSTSVYIYLTEQYEAKGYSEEEIAALAQIYLIEDEELHEHSAVDGHGSVYVSVYHPEWFSWLLSKVK